jgi:hypothetical protein
MKRFAFFFVLVLSVGALALSIVVAQKDFSIYPMPESLTFGTRPEPLNQEGYAFTVPSALPPTPTFSMQYVYPDDAVMYSMRFVEPDPNTDYSLYTPEQPTQTVQLIPEQPQP